MAKTGRWTGWILLVLLPLASVGCDRIRSRRLIDDAAYGWSEEIANLDLAPAEITGLAPLEPRAAVVVTQQRIVVSNASLVSQWWHDVISQEPELIETSAVAQLLVGPTRVAQLSDGKISPADLSSGGYLIDPLFSRLDEMTDIEKQFGKMTGRRSSVGRLAVFVEREVPFRTVAQVLYSAGQAEYGDIGFVLGGESSRVLPLNLPRIGPSEPESPPKPLCFAPTVGLFPSGLQVVGRKQPPGGIRLLALLGTKGDAPRPAGKKRSKESAPRATLDDGTPRPLLAAPGRCPSIPAKGSRPDLAAFEDLLRRMERLGPPCPTATIAAQPETPWEDVAAVMQRIYRSHPSLVVSPGLAKKPDCSEGLLLEE